MAKKQQKVFKRTLPRNPADVRAGIQAEYLGKSSAAQRTPTREEVETFQKTGRSPAMQERLRATKRADPSAKGDVQRAVDARNKERGFGYGDVPLRKPAGEARQIGIPQKPVAQGVVDPIAGSIFDPKQPFNMQSPQETGGVQEEERGTFLSRLGETLSGEGFSDDPGFDQPLTKDVAIGATAGGLALGAGAIALSTLASLTALPATASVAVKQATKTGSAKVSEAATGKLTSSVIRETIKLGGGRVMVNTYTAAKTTSLLSKIYASKAIRAGIVITGGAIGIGRLVMDVLGTYPFAGFIKEESLQTLGLSSSKGIDAIEWKIRKGEAVTEEEINLVNEALAQEKLVLEPDAYGSVIGSVPQKNIVDNLNEFYDSADIARRDKEARLKRALEKLIQTENEKQSVAPELVK